MRPYKKIGARFPRPNIETLEHRNLPDASSPSIFGIASQVYQSISYEQIVYPNMGAIKANPTVGQQVQAALAGVTKQMQVDSSLLAQSSQQAAAAAQAELNGLSASLSTATSQTINNYNTQIMNLENAYAELPPSTQAQIGQLVYSEIIKLQDDAAVQITNYKEFVDGAAYAVITSLDQQNQVLIPLIVQAQSAANTAQLEGQILGVPSATQTPTTPSSTLSGNYHGVVADTNGNPFTSPVTGQNFVVAGGQISGTVIFTNYPIVQNNVVVGTTPNIAASVNGNVNSQGTASGTFTIQLPSGPAQLTFTGTVQQGQITLTLTDSMGNPAGTITLN
jgi:hypothetical protein